MKKILLLSLIVTLILSLSACGKDKVDKNNNTTEPEGSINMESTFPEVPTLEPAEYVISEQEEKAIEAATQLVNFIYAGIEPTDSELKNTLTFMLIKTELIESDKQYIDIGALLEEERLLYEEESQYDISYTEEYEDYTNETERSTDNTEYTEEEEEIDFNTNFENPDYIKYDDNNNPYVLINDLEKHEDRYTFDYNGTTRLVYMSDYKETWEQRIDKRYNFVYSTHSLEMGDEIKIVFISDTTGETKVVSVKMKKGSLADIHVEY